MSLSTNAAKLARLLKQKDKIMNEIKMLRKQEGAKVSPNKPEPTTFDSERKRIMRTTNTEAGQNRALMNLAKKYRRPIKIAGKMFYPPKDIGPPTRGGRTPMKKGGTPKKKKGMARGGMKKKGMARGGMKKKGYSKGGLKPAPNKGAASLPKGVRNKMGFMKKGGMTKKKGMARGGMKKKGYAKGGAAKKSKK